jgi:hypothetical protein
MLRARVVHGIIWANGLITAASAICHNEQGTDMGTVRHSSGPKGSGTILGQVEEHERRGLKDDVRLGGYEDWR